MVTVNDVIKIIENIAKPEYAYSWDNCGLCVGDKKANVKNILITLDVTEEVISEAIEKNCQMIISHHPLIFKPVLNVNEDTYAGQIISLLYKNDISLYCAHTSLDIADNGVNDALCEKLNLQNIKSFPVKLAENAPACARTGEFRDPINKQQLIDLIKKSTGASILNYYLEDKMYKKIALSTGAGEEFAFDIKDEDVFLTGEIKYHTALELKRRNISFIAAGHYFTEVHFIEKLKACLQNEANMLQYKITFLGSKTNTNPFEN